mmetsp:Transcript_39981/g.78798  ORF Transcript_39981/g.78798 Transcript_39981/m.78798 type:complete len:208 (-) Transcript_39981:1100-1723(-)
MPLTSHGGGRTKNGSDQLIVQEAMREKILKRESTQRKGEEQIRGGRGEERRQDHETRFFTKEIKKFDNLTRKKKYKGGRSDPTTPFLPKSLCRSRGNTHGQPGGKCPPDFLSNHPNCVSVSLCNRTTHRCVAPPVCCMNISTCLQKRFHNSNALSTPTLNCSNEGGFLVYVSVIHPCPSLQQKFNDGQKGLSRLFPLCRTHQNCLPV